MTSFQRIVGIVLAAGESRRMGKPKQLLPFRGQTLLECVVDSALASRLHRVIVVLGHEADALAPLLDKRNATIVRNPHFQRGQSTSLKAGLQALEEQDEAALFLLGDQPLVSPELIDLLLTAYQTSPSPIVLPVFEGKRGNPVLFSRETFPRLSVLQDDCGARPLFEDYADRLLKVPVTDPSIHFDIDTKDDYLRLLHQEHQRSPPPSY